MVLLKVSYKKEGKRLNLEALRGIGKQMVNASPVNPRLHEQIGL